MKKNIKFLGIQILWEGLIMTMIVALKMILNHKKVNVLKVKVGHLIKMNIIQMKMLNRKFIMLKIMIKLVNYMKFFKKYKVMQLYF